MYFYNAYYQNTNVITLVLGKHCLKLCNSFLFTI